MTRFKGLWTVLFEVEDADVREDLALVATAIQVHFVSRVTRERAVVEFMAIRFRWPASRTRKRLQGLVDLGVLRCSRDLADNWTKVYEVVDRPHVPAAFARLVAEHQEVRGDEHEDLPRDLPHRPVPDRDDLAVRLELEREPHLPARGNEPPHRAVRPVGDRLVERALRRPDEGVRDHLGRIRDPGQDVVPEREAEREAREPVPADAGETVSHEPAVGDPRAAEVLHGPLQRAADPLERRGDLLPPIRRHLPGGVRGRP